MPDQIPQTSGTENGQDHSLAADEDELAEDYQEEEEWHSYTTDYVQNPYFPIGYTIEFSPGPPDFAGDDAEDGGSGQAPRGGLGSQALPVSNRLRADWDGVPIDGAEYLFTVRQEARERPRVVAKDNPYALAKPPKAHSIGSSKCERRRSTPLKGCPSQIWRESFIFRFGNMRKSLQSQEPWHWDLAEKYRQPPSDNDESNWKIFISGRKTDATRYPPKPPHPLFLKALEQVTVLAILTHYRTWVQERVDSLVALVDKKGAGETSSNLDSECHTPPQDIILLSAHDGSWLMGLLSVLDSVQTAEDIYQLRELARTCKQVARIANVALDQDNEASADQEAAVAWMVIAAIADIWGQKDLWDD